MALRVSVMTTAREELFEKLCRDAVKLGRFRLASGQESDFFIDCKTVVLRAEGHRVVGEALCEVLREDFGSGGFELVGGVALGGCPLASAVAVVSSVSKLGPEGRGWDAVYVRKETKEHGTAKKIEGGTGVVLPSGVTRPRVVLLEDVLTTGGSSLRAIESLREGGYEVVGVLALVDRQAGGIEALEAVGVRATALFRRRDFVGG